MTNVAIRVGEVFEIWREVGDEHWVVDCYVGKESTARRTLAYLMAINDERYALVRVTREIVQ